MKIIAPANPAPTKGQLIEALAGPITKIIQQEMADEADVDRVWILRKVHKNYLYYRNLQNFAPALYQGLIDSTGIDGSLFLGSAGDGYAGYDYSQNRFRGYCRKLCAVLGTRIPNAIAVPNDPTDEADIQAARAANNAAQYIRMQCDLQVLVLWMVFSLYNFGTSFWNIEWVVDGDKYGYKTVPQMATEETEIGGCGECQQCGSTSDDDSGQTCPQCGGPMISQAGFSAPLPSALPPKQIPRGALEIEVTDGSEISVPLDSDGMKGTSNVLWLRREREVHKSRLLQKYGDTLRGKKNSGNSFDTQSASLQYGESIRSAMASPIGVARPKRESMWSVIQEDWTPAMYQLCDDKTRRQMFIENFPQGVRITAVRGQVVDLEARKLDDHWQDCQPEPTKRIMADPLGDDWIIAQDICDNILNQCNETIERANEPGFADPTRVDLDAYQRRRSQPTDLIPALRPAGGTLADLIFRPEPNRFSDQAMPFSESIESTAQDISGETPIIWGGDTSDPTARQSELKTNAAIRQLSVVWVMIGKSLEKVYEKSCALLAENEDGILAFSGEKENEYGKFDSISVVIDDLKGGHYHFEADEAIPMTWGQQRDLLMWMLDKPAEILQAWGLGDPMNIFEFKQLLGMPGMRVPNLATRDKGMDVIGQLLKEKPVPAPPAPDGKPGPLQSSIQPEWEDDCNFLAKLAKDYLTDNFELKQQNPNGYENVQMYGQACEAKANAPAPPPPVKATLTTTLKGSDLGDPAVAAALQKVGLVPPGTPVAAVPPPLKPGQIPPPGIASVAAAPGV